MNERSHASTAKSSSPLSPEEVRARRALAHRLRSLAQAGVEQLPRLSVEARAALERATVPTAGAPHSGAKGSRADAETPARTMVGSAHDSDSQLSNKETMPRKKNAPTSLDSRTNEDSSTSSSDSSATLDVRPLSLSPSLPKKQRETELKSLCGAVAECKRCTHLAKTRTQTVFGVGPSEPRLCFLGEAPGADEDRQGIPFVGRAGQLLTDIIEKGMKIRRDEVYILNILKCRPPGNRNPEPEEVANCRPFFERQLDILQPEFICCLGAVAAHNLLETTVPVGQLRGRWHDWRGVRVMVTYHPSYLLRNPSAKKHVWDDIQILMREMGLPTS